jgi:hypothetical protein
MVLVVFAGISRPGLCSVKTAGQELTYGACSIDRLGLSRTWAADPL